MRFMMLVKHAEELSGPPPKGLMDAIDKLTEEANQARTMVVAGGLAPVKTSTHVRVARGELKTTDGPFSEAKEVIGGFAIFDLNPNRKPSKARSVSWNFTANIGPAGKAKPKSAKFSALKILSIDHSVLKARCNNLHQENRRNHDENF